MFIIDIRSYVEDLNPTLLSTIDTEFEKAAKRTPPAPTRVQGVNFLNKYIFIKNYIYIINEGKFIF